MTFDQFIALHNGRYVEMGGSINAQNQCVDLANAYIKQVLNEEIILGTNAEDFPSKCMGFCDWIPNQPSLVPENGDIVIWDTGAYGHIAIFIEGNQRGFTSFDQNYPVGTPCHKQKHNYNGVIGWLRPKGVQMDCKKVIFNILEHEWRLMHNYAELDDAGKDSIRREIDEIYPQWANNEWAFASKQDQWFKEGGLTKPINCDSLVAEANKKIKELEAQLPCPACPPPTVCQQVKDMSAWEMIAEGIKKLFRV